MPLSLPRLDDRTFDQLVDEARLTLPRLAPAWTDHNFHDPGITLLELFAWLVEMDLYRLDRTSPAAFRAFLRLLGIEPHPPQVAETVVAFQVDSHSDPLHLVQSRHPIVTNQNGTVSFQLSRNLTVLPVRLIHVLCGTPDSNVDYSVQNEINNKRYPAFGLDPQVDQALYLGFDAPLEKVEDIPAALRSTQISLYAWVDGSEKDHNSRRRWIAECQTESTREKDCVQTMTQSEADRRQHYSARTEWEYYDRTHTWKPLSNAVDETRAFTLNGTVRFRALEKGQHAKGGIPALSEGYFIRCRLVRGYYECPPEIQHIVVNAVPARHARDVTTEETAQSNGRAAQPFRLQNKPVVAGSVSLMVDDEKWSERLNWDRLGPHDKGYVSSPETGEIFFGNGLHGRVPKADAAIRVKQYQIGGGASGNIPAGTLTKYGDGNTANVLQPFAASGGSDAESLEDAKGRAIAWLEEPRRAVTLKDFETLAQQVPGVPVARAHALVDHNPSLTCVPALGSIAVVVVPPCGRPAYEPGPDMLRAVKRYLLPRRTLTTELEVISPSFITVAVQARLHSEPEVDTQNLRSQARSKLDAFFHPLSGGQDGKGWPIGRDVYRSEVMALLNSIPGVTYVDDVGLQMEAELETYGGLVTFKRIIKPGDVPLQVRALLFVEPSVIAHRLVENACNELETYIRSHRGWLKHRKPETQRLEATQVLLSLPGVLHVEELGLSQESTEGLCENVPVCANSLIISGSHQITIIGGREKRPTRISKPTC